MTRKRRSKTPETSIGARIRAYAAQYAANGQRERAEGMLQAADLVDELSRGGTPAAVGSSPAEILVRLNMLEAAVAALERGGVWATVKTPSAPQTKRPLVTAAPKGANKSGDGAALSTGEERILTAVAQFEEQGISNDELTALVDYRATSLRTYLGNLRAAGLVTSLQGRHFATKTGSELSADAITFPVGRKLLEWWLPRLPAGESRILRVVAQAAGPIELKAIGGSTGFQSTSVRTYVGHLTRRRLIVRAARGEVRLAPLLEGDSPARQ